MFFLRIDSITKHNFSNLFCSNLKRKRIRQKSSDSYNREKMTFEIIMFVLSVRATGMMCDKKTKGTEDHFCICQSSSSIKTYLGGALLYKEWNTYN